MTLFNIAEVLLTEWKAPSPSSSLPGATTISARTPGRIRHTCLQLSTPAHPVARAGGENRAHSRSLGSILIGKGMTSLPLCGLAAFRSGCFGWNCLTQGEELSKLILLLCCPLLSVQLYSCKTVGELWLKRS